MKRHWQQYVETEKPGDTDLPQTKAEEKIENGEQIG